MTKLHYKVLINTKMSDYESFLERLHHTKREDIYFPNRLDPSNKENEDKYFWSVDDKIDIILGLTLADVSDKPPEPD